MGHSAFKHVSPWVGWFLLMELISVGCLAAYWMDIWHRGLRLSSRIGLGVVVTFLLVAANVLLLRHRRWAALGFGVCWLLLAWLMMPVL